MKLFIRILAFASLFHLLALPAFATKEPEQTPAETAPVQTVAMRESTGTLNDVTLRIRLPQKSSASAEQRLLIEISVENKSKKPVRYGITNGIRDWGLVVRDEDAGGLVPRTRYGQRHTPKNPDLEVGSTKYVSQLIAPGATMTLGLDLSRLYDLTMPGLYSVTAQHVFNDKGDGENTFKIKTDPLRFEVTD